MSFFPCRFSIALALALGVGVLPATAQTLSDDQAIAQATQPAGDLAAQFSGWAGSTANAESLVSGLRAGTTVTVAGAAPADAAVNFSAPTGPLGYGNIAIALGLAQQSLQSLGVTQPTPQQLQAALVGGIVTVGTQSINMTGVLAQRAAGMGWGQIANGMGTHLGAVVSAPRSQRPEKAPGIQQAQDKSAQRAEQGDAPTSHARNADRGQGARNGAGRGDGSAGSGGRGGGGNGGGNGGGGGGKGR